MGDIAAKEFLKNTGWLSGEPEWLCDALLASARVSAWKAGELIFMVGDEPGGIYGIVDGGVGTLVPSGGSEMVLCHVLRPGSWFGFGPLFVGGRRHLTFRTVEPTRIAQSMIGQMANCSRDRVNQALRKFARAGWITADYKSITVNDLAALEAFIRGGQQD